jgi:hypothetical protein
VSTKKEHRSNERLQPSGAHLLVWDWGWDGTKFWVRSDIVGRQLPAYLEIEATFRSVEGGLEIDDLRLSPGLAHPPGGLITDDLRLIRLNELARAALARIIKGEKVQRDPTGLFSRNLPRAPKNWAKTLKTRPGRAGREDIDYARIAERYIAHLTNATPVVVLADELKIGVSQTRNLLYEARRRGLLTAAPKGKPGGSLTRKAIKLLEGGEQR